MFETKINLEDLEKAFTEMPRALRFHMNDGLLHVGSKFLKALKKTRLSGPPGLTGKRGGLITRFKKFVRSEGKDGGLKLTIFTNSEAAALHEKGGTISAAGLKLRVPLSNQKDKLMKKSGGYRKPYLETAKNQNIKPIPIRGKVFLAEVKKRKDEITPLFVLKDSIRIKPRLGFYDLWKHNERTYYDTLSKHLVRGVNEAWGEANA